MNNKRATKRALLTSIMALVMCVVMLVGTTFAWFTDTASTGVNKIQAGNLDIQLLMRGASDAYENIGDSHQVIFGGANSLVAQNDNQDTLWEPGKTQVAYLAVRNAGNLALKYNIILNVKDEGLIGALDYVIVPQGTLFGDNQRFTGTVNWSDVKANAAKLTAGTFTAAPNGCLDEIAHNKTNTNETEYFALVVHMDENAGNTYMSKSVTIDMKVVATQAAAEFDSFDDQYDKDATYPVADNEGLKDAIGSATDGSTVVIASGEYDLPKFDASEAGIPAGATIAGAGADKTTLNVSNDKIAKDNVTLKDMTIKGSGSQGTGGTLNINGNNTTIENVDYKGDGNIAVAVSTGAGNTGTTFRGTKITDAFRGIQFWSLSGDSVIDNCVLDVAGYTFNIDAAVADSTLTITDSTLNGWTSYTSGIKLVTFENCKLGLNAYQYLRPYSETKLVNCEFTSAGYQLNAGGSDAYTITLDNCTKNGTAITATNVNTLLLDTEGWNTNAILIVNGVSVSV